jgi:teichuronic acid biosynthesis glycosyltransferase TuaG
MKDLVSIITPVYNSELNIEKCLNSVINQSYSFFEHILVDDMSTDNSVKIIEKYTSIDDRLKLIRLDKNSGAGVARNKAIEMANGRFIAFLDADDYWQLNKLNKQLEFMLKNNFQITYTKYYAVNANDSKILFAVNSPNEVSFKSMLKNDYIGCLTLMYDSEKLGKIYMPEIRRRQDYAFKLRLLKIAKKAYCLDEYLAFYSMNQNSLSSNKVKLLRYNYSVFRTELNFSKLKSFMYLVRLVFYNLHFKRNSRLNKPTFDNF